MGTRFKCGYCPGKFKTKANKKKHEGKVCTLSRSPAGAMRRAYTPTPEPEDGEGSVEDMSVGSDGEDPNAGSTGKTDRGAQRPHAPQTPLPIPEREFRRAILQEPLKDLEYTITLEEPKGQDTGG